MSQNQGMTNQRRFFAAELRRFPWKPEDYKTPQFQIGNKVKLVTPHFGYHEARIVVATVIYIDPPRTGRPLPGQDEKYFYHVGFGINGNPRALIERERRYEHVYHRDLEDLIPVFDKSELADDFLPTVARKYDELQTKIKNAADQAKSPDHRATLLHKLDSLIYEIEGLNDYK